MSLLLGGLGCALPLSATAANRTGPVLPPGLERRVESLLGPQAQSELPGGWRLGAISIQAQEVRYELERAGDRIHLVLRAPAPGAAHNSSNFSIGILDPASALSAAEKQRLERTLAGLIQQHDTGPSPWIGPAAGTRDGGPPASSGAAEAPRQPAWYELGHPTRQLQALMLLVLLGLGLGARRLAGLLRSVGRIDAAWLGAATLIGLGVRLLVGPRVPAWINNHGYELLNELFLHPLPGGDPHGNTLNALHGLAQAVGPQTEPTFLATQTALSAATVPLVYLVGRAWLGDRRQALWAALVAAVLPVSVYFAASEVRPVSGTFFLLASLAALGWCIRDPHPVPRFVAAALAVITTQAYPTLMVAPLVLLLFIGTAPGGRALLKQPWSWVAAAAGLALYTLGAVRVLSILAGGTGIHGPEYLHSLMLMPKIITPTWDFGWETCNTWLNHHYTPPLLWLCSAVALAAGALERKGRGPVLAIAASALLLTLVNLVDGRMNTARIQLPAQALYCLLAGAGLYLLHAWLSGLAERWPALRRHKGIAAGAVVAVGLGASIAIWPGPLNLLGTPQRQHRFIAQALAAVPAECTIVHPADGSAPVGRLPYYLRGPDGRRHRWSSIVQADLQGRLSRGECLIYYRPAGCYEHKLFPVAPISPSGLVQTCAMAEHGLTLRPLETATIEAVTDNSQRYTRKQLPIGFFSIEAGPR